MGGGVRDAGAPARPLLARRRGPGARAGGPRRHGVLLASRAPLEPAAALGVPWPESALALRTGALEVHVVHVPNAANGLIKPETLAAMRAGLAARRGAPVVACGDWNTPRRELPDGTVWSFARDGKGRLREARAGFWDDAELGVVPGLAELGYADAFRSLHGYASREPSWAWRHGGGWRLDHVMCSAALEPAPPPITTRGGWRGSATTRRSRSTSSCAQVPPRKVDKTSAGRTHPSAAGVFLPRKGVPMQRAAVLWRANPARLLIALFALLLAGGMVAATGANFNSTSSNPDNIVTAGIISHATASLGAILNVTKLMPGTPANGTVTITNTGDAAARPRSRQRPQRHADDARRRLSAALEFADQRERRGDRTGTLDELASLDLGAWAVGDVRAYDFEVVLPDTGTDGSDNDYQGASTSVDLTWELTS